MKTHILNLENHDDVYSIIDKIKWGNSDRILLVFPTRHPLLENRLELQLVHRHSRSSGGQIALVTRHYQLKQYAAELDIPVFPSLRQAQQIPWESVEAERSIFTPKKTQKEYLQSLGKFVHTKPKGLDVELPAARWAIFLTGLFAFFSVLVVLLPRAEIRLTPQTQIQELKMTLSADPRLTTYNLAGVVPAETITVVVEGRDSLRPTGSIAIPQDAAQGEVVFTNLTAQAITVPAGTAVRTVDENPVRFTTDESVTLDAQAGASAAVPVTAVNPGTAGNLPEDSLVTVEGNLGLSLTATNPEPTTGGSEHASVAPTTEDYDQLAEQLRQALWDTAIQEASGQGDPRDTVISSAPVVTTVLIEEFTPTEPQPTTELTLLLRVEYQIMIIPWSEVQSFANRSLDAALPQGFTALPNTIEITPLSEPTITEENSLPQWEILAQRNIYQEISEGSVGNLVSGASIQQARSRLQNAYALDKPSQFFLFPNWWPRLPFLPLRISVTQDL